MVVKKIGVYYVIKYDEKIIKYDDKSIKYDEKGIKYDDKGIKYDDKVMKYDDTKKRERIEDRRMRDGRGDRRYEDIKY